MKKILSILLTVSIIFSCINLNVFAETTGALSISAPVTANPGETVNVTVSVPSKTNAISGSFNVIYDNTLLEVVSSTSGTILNGKNVSINNTYASNKVRMSFDGETALEDGGVAINVTFKVLAGASGTVNFEVEKFKLYDENYNAIDVDETAITSMYIINDAETKITVSCAETVNTGESITVTVDIANALNVCGGRFNLVYDSQKFTLSSAALGTVLSAYSKYLNKTYATNKIRLSWAGTSPMEENGTLLTLVFAVNDGVSGTSDFMIENLEVGDVSGNTVECLLKSASSNVVCTHNNMEWTVTTEPSCTEAGVENYMCGCGYYTETREISATGHLTMQWKVTTDSTCDNPGIKSYTCLDCGYVENTEEIEAHGHVYSSVVTAPTQSEEGFTTHTCTECGYTYTDSVTAAIGYTISYNANGGENAPISQSKQYDESILITAEVPTRTGYTFLGWSSSKDTTIAEFPSGSSFSKNEDITLYAVWTINQYTITYVVDGETFAVQSYDYGTVIEALSEPTKEGYTFSGWNDIPVTMPDENVIVTGSFTINAYNVSLNTNNNDAIFYETVVEHGTTIVLPTETPELENSTFIGWATKQSSRKAEYNPGDKIVVKENIILYAIWNSMWDGTVADSFAGGNGTIINPYRIENASQLFHMAEKINSGEESYLSAYYILTNNITIFDIRGFENWDNAYSISNWTPIGTSEHPFSGVFDGNGYIIKGIYINKGTKTEEYNNQGLFGFVDGATISNLGITDSYIRAYDNVGMFVANAENVKIRNSYNKGTVIGNNNIGGLVGNVSEGSTTNISGCYNEGEISGNKYIGGICGCVKNSIIYSCYNEADIVGINGVGGVLGGGIAAYVSTSHNKGKVGDDTTKATAGGICGYLDSSKVDLCYNAGTVTAYSCDFGGIAGFAGYGTSILRSYNVSEIAGTGAQSAGGIVGAMYHQDDEGNSNLIENCLNTGNVTAKTWTGGICGYLLTNSTMIRCINIGTVSADSNYGALSGYLSGTVNYSYYLSGSGPATSGTSLTWKQMQLGYSFSGFSDTSTGINMHDRWILQNNPYTAFPTLRNNDALTAIPIEFDLNGGYFDEYVYSIRTYAQGTNISRGLNSLVVYNNSDTLTGTNSYGREAIVNSRNEVISIGGNNNTVPNGGFILSGNGISSIWIEDNIEIGDRVYYDSGNCEIKVYKKNLKITCAYGYASYLPTPHKNGYVFSGWQDESGNTITYSTKMYSTGTLNLKATWTKPEVAAETTYGNSKYIMFDVGTSYESAKKYCEELGGHLATVTSAEENAAVAGMTATGGGVRIHYRGIRCSFRGDFCMGHWRDF